MVVEAGGRGAHKNIHFPSARSRSVGRDLKSCKCYSRKILAKLILIIPYQHICMEWIFFFFFLRRQEFMISGAWARGLFRNSQHFDLITKSKYS